MKETEASRASLQKQAEELKAKAAELRRRELALDARAVAAPLAAPTTGAQTQSVAGSPQSEQLVVREAALAVRRLYIYHLTVFNAWVDLNCCHVYL